MPLLMPTPTCTSYQLADDIVQEGSFSIIAVTASMTSIDVRQKEIFTLATTPVPI